MKNWIVKAFHTGGPYENDAAKLVASAEKFDIPIDIEVVKSRGSWNANTHYKPQSVLNAMNKHQGKSIVHIDVDAWFLQYPELFDKLDCDFAAYWWRDGTILCSGTLWFKNSLPMIGLVQTWDGALKQTPDQHGDQVALGKILGDRLDQYSIEKLPPGYLQALAPNIIKGEGVIAHDGARKRYVGTAIYTDPK